METKNKLKISPIGLFVIIAFAVVFFLIGYILNSFFGQRPQKLLSTQNSQESALLSRADMRLLPVSENLTIGQESQFEILINTFDQTINGTDAVILYNPKLIKIIAIQTADSVLNQNFIFPRKQIEDGRIYLTAVRDNLSQQVSGQYTLAKITFRALFAGEAEFNLEFFPGETYGSTIIQSQDSQNILDKVEGFKVKIE